MKYTYISFNGTKYTFYFLHRLWITKYYKYGSLGFSVLIDRKNHFLWEQNDTLDNYVPIDVQNYVERIFKLRAFE
jgi:hypothetical protein